MTAAAVASMPGACADRRALSTHLNPETLATVRAKAPPPGNLRSATPEEDFRMLGPRAEAPDGAAHHRDGVLQDRLC